MTIKSKISSKILCIKPFRPAQSGFTMIEVLVTVLVLAIGLLGYASMQLSSVNNNLDAYHRSQATLIAKDLATRINVNRNYTNWDVRAAVAGGATGDQNVYNNTPTTLTTGFTCTTITKNCATLGVADPNPANSCDEQEMARFDVESACFTADGMLPGGTVHVRCNDRPLPVIAAQTGPRSFPYPPSHRTYPTPPASGLLVGPANNDACRPGSQYTIYVSWNRAGARQDSGQNDLVGTRCINELGFAADGSRDCIAIDLIP